MMTTGQAGLFIALLGFTCVIAAIIILICDKSRIKRYSSTTLGTVTGHKWISVENMSYPVAILSYNVNGQFFSCRQRYRAVIYNSVKHAEADWEIDDKYRLHSYVTRKCERHVNPIEDWFPVGSQMPVHYNPNKPKKAYCGSLINLSIMWIVIGSVGLFVMMIGGMLMMIG